MIYLLLILSTIYIVLMLTNARVSTWILGVLAITSITIGIRALKGLPFIFNHHDVLIFASAFLIVVGIDLIIRIVKIWVAIYKRIN